MRVLLVTVLLAAHAAHAAHVASLVKLDAVTLANHYDRNLAFKSPIINKPDLARVLPDAKKAKVAAAVKAHSASFSAKALAVPTIKFLHGVASGDPIANAVILWTKVVPTDTTGTATVEYHVATDVDFKNIVKTGAVVTSSEVDFTVKVDATGLQPETKYFYRFLSGGVASPVGKTKTLMLADAKVDSFKAAILTCSNMPHGYFHAYGAIARDDSIDVAIHVGDYIYEYDLAGYTAKNFNAPAANRVPIPNKVISSLLDYRTRHAQYKQDPNTLALHLAKPVIAVWDDHEFADNAFANGASNQDDKRDGPWGPRKLAGARAYHEYMPIRPDFIMDGAFKIYRSFQIGNLVDLFMVDTRIDGRSEQAKGNAADRTLMGPEQTKWLYNGLLTSNKTWKVLGNQVMFAPKPTKVLWIEINALSDDWNGYPTARQGLLDTVTNAGIQNTVVITGDFHASVASDIFNGNRAVMTEYVGPSVTSVSPLNDYGWLNGIADKVWGLINKGKRFSDFANHGYMAMQFTQTKLRTEYIWVDKFNASPSPPVVARVLEQAAGANRITKVY
ncbi:PhoD-like phosphatase-domain-containing protein [Blastocladiella britannica]|nr:PhoD-like phosphatase-domain-containing protein [Blastocladiella britannica]